MLTYISLGQKYFVKRFGFVLRSDKWQNRDVDAKLAVKKDVPAGKSGTKNKLIVSCASCVLDITQNARNAINETLQHNL